jgi:subtilisin-like proprotein convertase family protein
MNYKYFKQILFILFFTSFSIVAQNAQERQSIIKDYDLLKLNNLKEEYSLKFLTEKNRAFALAAQKGWKLKFTDAKGSYHELMGVTNEGNPLYYKTDNVDAAISTRTNFLHNDGGLGLNIEGQGMTAYVWDGGLARETHQEYDGDGGENRFSIGDGSTELNFHAAHVMGTIISSGFDPAAKGMAPKAKGIGSNWTNDLAEATEAAANGMLVSNHSYGFGADDIPDYYFGAYIEASRDWDNLMYNAPYYLHVTSAGNDGNSDTANANPLDGNSAFNKINGRKTAKNSVTIANGRDASINVDGSLASVDRNTSSSEGPTDDLRVKPDLMGNGTGLYSSYESADDAYNSISGTSMAAPNVTGSLLLLQQYHNETYGAFMRAATLKGLALHTADDVDIEGPDSHTGWGLMNTKVAAETITKKGFESWISEEVLTNGSSYTLKVKSVGSVPLLASISWTDKPGIANEGVANDPTAVLVNDLDIKVTRDADQYDPWRLTGVYSNEKGDNLVDPFERVDISNPSPGEYTIKVTHKGTLDEDQHFSLIITGISGEFNFIADSSEKAVCSEADVVFDFAYRQALAGTTQFTATGAPEAMSIVFSKQSLSANGDFNITFGNLINVAAGPYDIEITGDNGSETQKRSIRLYVYHQLFDNNPSALEFPVNGQKAVSKKLSLLWENNLNAENYKIEVSNSPSFNNMLFTDVVIGTSFDLDNLDLNTAYYWRIKPKNRCGEGMYSSIYSFQTGVSDCTNVYTATDFSSASIGPFTANVTATVPINVTNNVVVNKVIVTTDIAHTGVQDLTILLETPASIGGARVVLLRNACDETNNISTVTFDDDASALVCDTADPAISGSIAPVEDMSLTSRGKNAVGEWKLIVEDNAASNGGEVNSVSITICSVAENTSIPSFSSTSLMLDGNLNYVITSSNMNASSDSETESEQMYILVELPNKGALKKEDVVVNVGDTFTQADITSGKITFTNSETGSFRDQFKVDIINAAKGWLPNQVIMIEEGVLQVDTFLLNAISLWPNPAKRTLNVKLNTATREKVVITLFDLQGRKIITSVNMPSGVIFTKEIEIENISSGVYLLTIEQGNKKATKKIIVSK